MADLRVFPKIQDLLGCMVPAPSKETKQRKLAYAGLFLTASRRRRRGKAQGELGACSLSLSLSPHVHGRPGFGTGRSRGRPYCGQLRPQRFMRGFIQTDRVWNLPSYISE